MNNIEKSQENQDKKTKGQGDRTEKKREGREAMRGANTDSGGHRNLSAREREEDMEEEDFDDTGEASLDDAYEDEEELGFEGTERSDLGFHRGRDGNRGQPNQI